MEMTDEVFYGWIERIVQRLADAGLPVSATDLESSIRAGSTSGEVLGDIRNALRQILSEQKDRLPPDLAEDVQLSLTAVDGVLIRGHWK